MLNRLASLCLVFFFAWPSAIAEPSSWEIILPALERSSLEHVHPLPNGDVLVAGHVSLTSPYYSGLWIARYTGHGDQVWAQEFIGQAHSRVAQLKVEADRIILVGTHLVQNPFVADSAGVVAALSLDGDILWETWLMESGASLWPSHIEALADGDFLVSGGRSTRDGAVSSGAVFARLSPGGVIEWIYTPDPVDSYYDDLPALGVTARSPDGHTMNQERAGPVSEQDSGDLHLHIVRRGLMPAVDVLGRCDVVSSDGQLKTQQSCDRLESEQSTSSKDVHGFVYETVAPGVIFAKEILVSKVDENGSLIWTWTYETAHRSGLTDAVPTSDGGLIGVGYLINDAEPRSHRYDAVVFRLDGTGQAVWSYTFQSPKRDIFTAISAWGEDDYILVGHTGATADSGWWDPWILRLGLDGQVESVVAFR